MTASAMEERKKIDFKRHALPPVSRKHLWRIVFYLVVLTTLLVIFTTLTNAEKPTPNPVSIEQIEGVQIDVP